MLKTYTYYCFIRTRCHDVNVPISSKTFCYQLDSSTVSLYLYYVTWYATCILHKKISQVEVGLVLGYFQGFMCVVFVSDTDSSLQLNHVLSLASIIYQFFSFVSCKEISNTIPIPFPFPPVLSSSFLLGLVLFFAHLLGLVKKLLSKSLLWFNNFF